MSTGGIISYTPPPPRPCLQTCGYSCPRAPPITWSPQVTHMQTKLIAPPFVHYQVSSAQSWAAPCQRLSRPGHQSHYPPLPHFCLAGPASQMSHESIQSHSESMLEFVPPTYLTWATSLSPSVWVLHPQQTPSLYHKQHRALEPGLNSVPGIQG